MLDPKRREFIALVGGGGLLLAAKVKRARGQQPALPVIGFLNGQSPRTWGARLDAFRKGLNESGYDEGRNVAIEYRWAEGQPDRLPALAIDLVQRQVAVIVATGGSNPAIAAKAATSTTPIVFTSNDDPRKYGLVASLNRPGGNVTGVSWFSAELGPKRLALLRELLPNAMTVAVLRNPNNAEQAGQPAELQKAARTLGLQLLVEEQRVILSTFHRVEIQPGVFVGDVPKRYTRHHILILPEYFEEHFILLELLLFQRRREHIRFVGLPFAVEFFPGVDRHIQLRELYLQSQR